MGGSTSIRRLEVCIGGSSCKNNNLGLNFLPPVGGCSSYTPSLRAWHALAGYTIKIETPHMPSTTPYQIEVSRTGRECGECRAALWFLRAGAVREFAPRPCPTTTSSPTPTSTPTSMPMPTLTPAPAPAPTLPATATATAIATA